MYPIVIISIILIILIIDNYVYTDTNKMVRYQYIQSNKPKIVVISSMHGNEPAGSHSIKQLNNDFITNKIQLKQGELIMFPFINKYGGYLNYRYTPSLTNCVDLNRIWYTHKKSNYPLIEELKDIINDAD